jgi:predicted RNase H-like HicB family nuclease
MFSEECRGSGSMALPLILTPGEDGYLVAECPVMPGCISLGRAREEAPANIREARVGSLASTAAPVLDRIPIPPDLKPRA